MNNLMSHAKLQYSALLRFRNNCLYSAEWRKSRRWIRKWRMRRELWNWMGNRRDERNGREWVEEG